MTSSYGSEFLHFQCHQAAGHKYLMHSFQEHSQQQASYRLVAGSMTGTGHGSSRPLRMASAHDAVVINVDQEHCQPQA